MNMGNDNVRDRLIQDMMRVLRLYDMRIVCGEDVSVRKEFIIETKKTGRIRAFCLIDIIPDDLRQPFETGKITVIAVIREREMRSDTRVDHKLWYTSETERNKPTQRGSNDHIDALLSDDTPSHRDGLFGIVGEGRMNEFEPLAQMSQQDLSSPRLGRRVVSVDVQDLLHDDNKKRYRRRQNKSDDCRLRITQHFPPPPYKSHERQPLTTPGRAEP